MTVKIHPSWYAVLEGEFEKLYWQELTSFVKGEYSQVRCFPLGKDIFRAFDLTPFDRVKVVILGQDPYHTAYTPVIPATRGILAKQEERVPWGNAGIQSIDSATSAEGQRQQERPICAAMGLSFSVPDGSKPQPSLRNIFKELEDDTGVKRTKTDLTDWAEQGVLLLNAVLTVRQGLAASHQGKGWESFTDAAIRAVSQRREGIVFILWGNYAIAKKSLIDTTRHLVITSAHPSPFSADRGFFGSKPFSRANAYLSEQGSESIVWG